MNKNTTILFFSVVITLCFLASSPSRGQETVWLTVEGGTGLEGDYKQVDISINNSEEVTSIEMKICDDEEDYLNTQECSFTSRQVGADCTCMASEVGGCAWVYFNGSDCSIGSGDGPVLNVTYRVKNDAPPGECRDLEPQEVVVEDEFGDPFPPGEIGLTAGVFCFKCIVDEDCPATGPCFDKSCDGNGICQFSYRCDDGLYCNGFEPCNFITGECGEGDDPCYPQLCDEGGDGCYCTENAHCEDGLYCTGVANCVDQACQRENPCVEPTPVCNEDPPQCEAADVTLTVHDGAGSQGSQDNLVDVWLFNPIHQVAGIIMDICDEGYYLACTECITEGLITEDFDCSVEELTNGCCRINLLELSGGSIIPGNRHIFTLTYDVSEGAPYECIEFNQENVDVANKNPPPQELTALSVSGEFCVLCKGNLDCNTTVDGLDAILFKVDFGELNCTNEDPCKSDFDCDGDVDGIDAVQFKADFGELGCTPCPGGIYPLCTY